MYGVVDDRMMGKLSSIRKLALVFKRGSPGNLCIVYYIVQVVTSQTSRVGFFPSFLRTDRTFLSIRAGDR